MELVVHNGKAFWSPVTENISINNFIRWEQAFRICSNIYTKRFPEKAPQLIEYNDLIHSISLHYVWDNIYAYDKEFHLHLSKHPERSWSVILQQAWSMKLRDRIHKGDLNANTNYKGYDSLHYNQSGEGTSMQSKNKSNEPCRRFNRGCCKFGPKCAYEHKCSYCGKFSHGVLRCRKLAADKE